MHDVIVIGGSYAGLAAALQLARARRDVLVLDTGRRRNRFAEHSHGFLTQDGAPAAAIAAQGRAQVLAYSTVQWRHQGASSARRDGDGFVVELDNGERCTARRLVLATGVIDRLPDIEGLAERWGRHIFHCPYCHGYELEQRQIGVLGVSPLSMHHALMLPDWGPTTLYPTDAFQPDESQRAQLSARGVQVEPARVLRIAGALDLHLSDGRVARPAGLFVASRIEPSSPIAGQLGCQFEETPMGSTVRTDFMKATTVPGVFACGDLARPGGSVAAAVGDGTVAGAGAHQSLMFGSL